MEKELRAVLTAAQHDIAKKEQFCLERYNLSEKLDIQNKNLWATIGSMTKELGMAHESLKASEKWVADLEKIVSMLQEDLSSARERSSKADGL